MVFEAIRKELRKFEHTNSDKKDIKILKQLLEKDFVSDIVFPGFWEIPTSICEAKKIFDECNFKIIKAIWHNPKLEAFIEILRENKIQSWIVGGFNRDTIAGLNPKDVDFVVEDIEKTKEVLKQNNIPFKEVGAHFGVILAKFEGESFEIANLRADKDNNGFKPGTLETDFERRDFDVNAIFFNLNKMELEDKLDKTGIENAMKRKFKFQGNPKERIKEDPLRVLRVFKLMKKGFEPEKKTLAEARRQFEFMTKNVNSNRLLSEIEKLILNQ